MAIKREKKLENEKSRDLRRDGEQWKGEEGGRRWKGRREAQGSRDGGRTREETWRRVPE